MKRIPLEGILLLIFGFMLLSRKGADPLFFALFFPLSFFYMLTGLINISSRNKIQTYLLFTTIVFLIVAMMVPDIIARAKGKFSIVHDNALQVEAAAEFLINGENPYTENYFFTPLNSWRRIMTTEGRAVNNYALLHCVKLPWDIIFPIPFKLFFEHTINFYDQRMLYLLLYIVSLFLVYALPETPADKNLLLVLFGLNPLFAYAVVIGVGDVFVLTWVLLFVYLLRAGKIRWAGFVLGLAFASKQSAWFLAPFYLMFLRFRFQNNRSFISNGWPMAVAPVLLAAPFVVWDPVSFWQDIYQYPAGTIPTSYHINGYGFSMLLYSRGILKSIYSAYPAWLLQVPLGGLLFLFQYKWQKRRNTISMMLANYGLFLFLFWFFSRFFHDNYLGYLSIIFIIAYFTHEEEQEQASFSADLFNRSAPKFPRDS